MSSITLGLALLASILVVSALASGIVDRAPLSFPMIFLGLGFLLGGGGLGVIELDAHSSVLEAVAIVSLALVLFLDAVNLQLNELRQDWHIPTLALGPGTLLIIGGIALATHLLFRTTVVESLLLGAILASTDPVVLRDVVRNDHIPRSIRRALSVEAGMNDLVVLPIVLILIAVLTANVGGLQSWIQFLAQLLLLSPALGLIIGGFGAWLIGRADSRFGIRREYQALYGLGLVLVAYTAGQAAGADGFLVSFFAGLSVTLFNLTLCDCFLEYGEVTSEISMLLAFVLFGAVLSVLFHGVPFLPGLILAIIALGLIRPLVFWLVLQRARISRPAQLFLGWFGPRGLNSLLLALIALQRGVPDAEELLTIAGLVVLVSVVLHGASATPLATWYGRRVSQSMQTLVEEREGTVVGLFTEDVDNVPRISAAELAQQLAGEAPPVVLDVRSRAQYKQDDGKIPGSLRVLPDQIAVWAKAQQPRPVVAYCT